MKQMESSKFESSDKNIIDIAIKLLPQEEPYLVLKKDVLARKDNIALRLSFNNEIDEIISGTYYWILFKEQQYQIIQYLFDCTLEEAQIYHNEILKEVSAHSITISNLANIFNTNIGKIILQKCTEKNLMQSIVIIVYWLMFEDLPFKSYCMKLFN